VPDKDKENTFTSRQQIIKPRVFVVTTSLHKSKQNKQLEALQNCREEEQ
jgi:hypothetical protein